MVWKAPYISTTGRMALSARWTFPYQEVLAIDKLLSGRRVLVIEEEMLVLIMTFQTRTGRVIAQFSVYSMKARSLCGRRCVKFLPIKGNTAVSIAMMASRFSSNTCQRA